MAKKLVKKRKIKLLPVSYTHLSQPIVLGIFLFFVFLIICFFSFSLFSQEKEVDYTHITIPFMGYLGINQTACTCTVGTLPSGVTVKSNTAATASKAGSVVLSFAANATLGGATVLNGTIDLTFTISGASVVKKFAWTKSNKGSNGASGANAIVFSVYAPEGTVAVSYTHLDVYKRQMWARLRRTRKALR